jgi:hypothetical protein
VLTDLGIPRKDFNWHIEHFEDYYVNDENLLQLGDGDKAFFVDSIDILSVEGLDEFSIEVTDGKEIILSLDSGDEDGEELEDCFYDFLYESLEKFIDGGISEEF